MLSSKNFSADELRCKCDVCNKELPHKVTKEALDKLQALRTMYGKPIVITSGYRCELHPNEVNKTVKGTHNQGIGFDIKCNSAEAYQLMKLAFLIGFTGIARGNGFIHLDIRKTTPVVWEY